jgi:hypothetical protein
MNIQRIAREIYIYNEYRKIKNSKPNLPKGASDRSRQSTTARNGGEGGREEERS